jgi:hypothetical protein
MKYAAEIVLGATIYVPSFIRIGPGIQKLMGVGVTQTAWRTLTLVFFFFKIREAG